MYMCVLCLLAPPASAGKVWDPYTAIDGELDDKVIEIAASSEDGDSTDTMGWMGSDDDRWIDGDQSTTSGKDADEWGGWGESSRCWWTTTDGTVSQYSFDTIWTAPYKQGAEANIEIAVVDLPKSIPSGETGSRGDSREYFGAQASNATAYWVVWHIRTSGSTSHGFDFNDYPCDPCGDGTQLGIVNPDSADCNGFHKKVEIVGVLDPRKPNKKFDLHQTKHAFAKYNGSTAYPGYDAPAGTPDDLPDHDISDAAGKVFMWDAPGNKFVSGANEWWKANPEWYSFRHWGHYTDKAYFNGVRCSAPFEWEYDLQLTGPIGANTWNKPGSQQ
ncbi:MAG TPA: hypothetical protein DGT21_03255 [Armatimonadetes bacterium]|nr:hypothetical protein [Armatimonadota bacterium]